MQLCLGVSSALELPWDRTFRTIPRDIMRWWKPSYSEKQIEPICFFLLVCLLWPTAQLESSCFHSYSTCGVHQTHTKKQVQSLAHIIWYVKSQLYVISRKCYGFLVISIFPSSSRWTSDFSKFFIEINSQKIRPWNSPTKGLITPYTVSRINVNCC